MRHTTWLILLIALPAAAREAKTLTVTSTAFANNGEIPADYTCEGRSTSPPLTWSAVPPETKSIAVIVDDPDAPRGTFDHFVLYNVPPGERNLPSQGASTLAGTGGRSARNDAGQTGFAPICPPSGRHHYRFQVLALDTTLPVSSGSSREVGNAISGHVIARGDLIGWYQKGKR